MKKAIVFATAALLFSGAAFATKGKKNLLRPRLLQRQKRIYRKKRQRSKENQSVTSAVKRIDNPARNGGIFFATNFPSFHFGC